jgi:hypothetical protein
MKMWDSEFLSGEEIAVTASSPKSGEASATPAGRLRTVTMAATATEENFLNQH